VLLLEDVAFDWQELSTIGIVGSIREVGDVVPQEIAIKYYISSTK